MERVFRPKIYYLRVCSIRCPWIVREETVCYSKIWNDLEYRNFDRIWPVLTRTGIIKLSAQDSLKIIWPLSSLFVISLYLPICTDIHIKNGELTYLYFDNSWSVQYYDVCCTLYIVYRYTTLLNPFKSTKFTSVTYVFATFRSTSGAIVDTNCEYSPSNHKIDALAWGTAMESINRAICLIISQWASGWFCNSFLITTTLSATTASKKKIITSILKKPNIRCTLVIHVQAIFNVTENYYRRGSIT